MPKLDVNPSDLSPEELQKRSQEEWRGIETKTRRALKAMLRKGNIPARELADVMRAAAVAKEQAYPDSSMSGIAINVPARLLKPIEQAILAQRQKNGDTNHTPKKESVDDSTS